MFAMNRIFIATLSTAVTILCRYPTSVRSFTTTGRYNNNNNNNGLVFGSSSGSTRDQGNLLLFSTKEPKHDVGGGSIMELTPEERQQMEAYGLHQQNAPKLGFPTDVRTLIQYNHGYAVLSTFSKADPTYPGGSVVGFTVDDEGCPIFIFSGMSGHTQDILANPFCSLTIAAKEFKGAADGRVNVAGKCELIRDPKEKEITRTLYLKKHLNAFWVDFGDFNWFRMSVDKVRFVGGFARAGSITAEEYRLAKPDPVSQFGGAIASHMNDDHMTATIAMIQNQIPGLGPNEDNPITEALITSVDSLGMNVKVTRTKAVPYLPQQFKVRLPFPRPASDRKDVKVMIMELINKAATSAKE